MPGTWTPSHLEEWAREMRRLGLAQLRTPEGLEIILGDEPVPAEPARAVDEAPARAPRTIRGPYDDPDLGVPSLPRDMEALRRYREG